MKFSGGRSRLIGGQFLKLLLAFRVVALTGRYGGGKTLLSVFIAYWLLATGNAKKIVSNIPIEHNADDGGDLIDTVIQLDESWQYIQSKQEVLNYAAYLRKINSYLLLPSVFDVPARLSFFTCTRLVNLQNVGLPIWVYRWQLNSRGAAREKGLFYLINPQRIYGLYDTKYVPGDDGGISKRLLTTIQHINPNAGIRTVGSYGAAAAVNAVDVDVYDAVQELDDVLDRIETTSKKSKRPII